VGQKIQWPEGCMVNDGCDHCPKFIEPHTCCWAGPFPVHCTTCCTCGRAVPRLPTPDDWRDNKTFYPTDQPCCVCGSTLKSGWELRFGYVVCELHSKLSPIEICSRKDEE
jgi:hypothetical protein